MQFANFSSHHFSFISPYPYFYFSHSRLEIIRQDSISTSIYTKATLGTMLEFIFKFIRSGRIIAEPPPFYSTLYNGNTVIRILGTKETLFDQRLFTRKCFFVGGIVVLFLRTGRGKNIGSANEIPACEVRR